MSSVQIDIDRVAVALHGVSSLVVEAAVSGLENEVRRRLGVLPTGPSTALYLEELAVGPVHSRVALDAAALRGLIAERLVEVIRHAYATTAEEA